MQLNATAVPPARSACSGPRGAEDLLVLLEADLVRLDCEVVRGDWPNHDVVHGRELGVRAGAAEAGMGEVKRDVVNHAPDLGDGV